VAKLIVQHDEDPGIAVILTETIPGTAGLAQGWRGLCTECGMTFHRWHRDKAEESARSHVDRHESSL
jgi:hypothetical protein